MPRHAPAAKTRALICRCKMPVRVTGPGRVVPDHRRLDLLHRHLHLPTPRPHPRRRVLGDPADDLLGRPVLRRIQRGRDLRMQGCRQRPGLRPVDGDLDEPQRVRVVPQPPLGPAGVDVVPGDPPLVGLAVEVASPASPSGSPSRSHRRRTGSRRRSLRPGSSRQPGSDRPRRRRARQQRSRGRTSSHHARQPPRIRARTRRQQLPTTSNNYPENRSWAARPRATQLRPS